MTRVDRLHRIIAKLAPKAAAEHADRFTWPGGEAPYRWKVVDGDELLQVKGEDGDVIGGRGKTKDDALGMIEGKLGIV